MSLKENLYKVYDLITSRRGVKRKLNGFSLRLPVRYYNFFPDNYEKENFDFLKAHCQTGNVVIDIGAHIGLFSVCASQLVGPSGKVYAFEPAPLTHDLLAETIAINQKKDIIITRKEAIGEKDGTTFFNVSDIAGDNSNTIIEYTDGVYRNDRDLHKVEIKITSIDNFAKEVQLTKLDFIKMDVEGYEFQALKGAKQTLKRYRPAGVLGIHPQAIKSNGDNLEMTYDLLRELGYEIIYDGKTLLREEFCSFELIFDVQLVPKPV
jgi:FkbM family methyltransferase